MHRRPFEGQHLVWIVVLMMAGSSAESLTLKDAFTNWLSITALHHIPPNQKSVFQKLEKLELKIIRLEGHLEFNQGCIINKLLLTYTHNYINFKALKINNNIVYIKYKMNQILLEIKKIVNISIFIIYSINCKIPIVFLLINLVSMRL